MSVIIKLGFLCRDLCYNCDLRVKIASVGETGSWLVSGYTDRSQSSWSSDQRQ